MKTLKLKEDALWEIWSGTESAAADTYEGDLEEIHRAMGIRKRRAPRIWLFSSIAAAVMLLVMAGEFILIKNNTHSADRVSYVTSPTSKGEFVLPDGSHVWLNFSSTLSFDKSNPRHVQLEGEGFFDVTNQDGQEFVVNTGSMAIKVLGTRFNVRSSSHFEGEEVSLVSGRVEIKAGESSVTLSPGERAGIENGIIKKESADVSFDASWAAQELIFDNAALSDIIVGLEHWFNVNIRVAPDVPMSTRLSFKIASETLEDTQKIISRITGCRFKTLDDQNIMITKH